MTINTQRLREAAQAVIDDFGGDWYDAGDWKIMGDDRPPVVDEQFIEVATPMAVVGLIDALDAQTAEIAEARSQIDRWKKAAESAEDRAQAAADEIDRLRDALRWNAAALNECCKECIREASNITIESETKCFSEILDMADAALAQEQGGSDGNPHH